MAGEPSIELKGYVGRVNDFQNGGSIVTVGVTPSYQDKNTSQWVDKPQLWFDVRPISNEAKGVVDEIRNAKQNNLSVRVLVNGGLSKRVSEKDGKTYEHLEIAARTLVVMSAEPKQQGNQNGFQPNYGQQNYGQGVQNYGQLANPMTPAYGAAQASQTGQPAVDPWSQPQTAQAPQTPQGEFEPDDEF